eukprot:1152148-Pelagomonas_calceolata.AAC.3
MAQPTFEDCTCPPKGQLPCKRKERAYLIPSFLANSFCSMADLFLFLLVFFLHVPWQQCGMLKGMMSEGQLYVLAAASGLLKDMQNGLG